MSRPWPGCRQALAIAVVAAVTVPAPAWGARRHRLDAQEPRWGFQVRTGPYAPRFGGRIEQQYYDAFFAHAHGNAMHERGPLLTAVEVGGYTRHELGLLGVLVRVGYWSVSGKMQVCVDGAGTSTLCTVETLTETLTKATDGNSETGITIMPVSLAGLYRMDLLKRHFHIPLVLHAKAGLDYHFWWVSAKGKRAKMRQDGPNAQGGTLGYSGSLGAALSLGWLEPRAASRGRYSSGIADSFLVVEVTHIVGNGFGHSERFDMSDTLLTLALAVDFL